MRERALSRAQVSKLRTLLPIIAPRKSDGGDSRALLIPASHNYPGFEGVSGPKLLDLLSRQAEHCGIKGVAGQVQQLERTESGFTASWEDGQLVAACAILATGLIDKRQPIARQMKPSVRASCAVVRSARASKPPIKGSRCSVKRKRPAAKRSSCAPIRRKSRC